MGENVPRTPVTQADIDELRRLYTVKEYDNGSFGRVLREAQERLDRPAVSVVPGVEELTDAYDAAYIDYRFNGDNSDKIFAHIAGIRSIRALLTAQAPAPVSVPGVEEIRECLVANDGTYTGQAEAVHALLTAQAPVSGVEADDEVVVCKNCGHGVGAHSVTTANCPNSDDGNFKWASTKFHRFVVHPDRLTTSQGEVKPDREAELIQELRGVLYRLGELWPHEWEPRTDLAEAANHAFQYLKNIGIEDVRGTTPAPTDSAKVREAVEAVEAIDFHVIFRTGATMYLSTNPTDFSAENMDRAGLAAVKSAILAEVSHG